MSDRMKRYRKNRRKLLKKIQGVHLLEELECSNDECDKSYNLDEGTTLVIHHVRPSEGFEPEQGGMRHFQLVKQQVERQPNIELRLYCKSCHKMWHVGNDDGEHHWKNL